MTNATVPQDLAGQAFWDDVWTVRGTHRLDRRNFYHELYARTFARVVRPGARVLEVGCGGSIWLPYLANALGAEVWGIDYSQNGVRVAEANLREARVAGHIVLGDLFTTTELPAQGFDFVFSFGLIEHFADAVATVHRVASFLAPNGRMLTAVPNMFGVVGGLHRLADPDLYQAHLRFDPSDLDAVHRHAGLRVVEAATHFGVFSLAVANFTRWRQRLPRLADLPFWFGVRAAQQVVLLPFRLLRWYPESRWFSPYIQGLYGKPAE